MKLNESENENENDFNKFHDDEFLFYYTTLLKLMKLANGKRSKYWGLIGHLLTEMLVSGSIKIA